MHYAQGQVINFKTKESMTINELLDKPVWQMTGGELLFLAQHGKTHDEGEITIKSSAKEQKHLYRASFPESKRDILYFDTEQSPYHCQLVMQRILSLAGLPLDQEPEHLKFSHLRAIAAPNQRRALIRYAIYNSPNLGLVIIDGIRDLMHDINNSAEATNLVGDLMQWTGEKNIHIQTVLHLNKGDDNARGHIGTELNNKAESVLLITKDTKDADRSMVSPAVIRSKAFAPFAFKLSEDDGICLPELDTEFAVTNSPSFSYQELSGEEHRKALQETFKTDTELGYGALLTRLSTAYQSICGRTYGQTKLKELLRFLLNKRMIVKAGRGQYCFQPDFYY